MIVQPIGRFLRHLCRNSDDIPAKLWSSQSSDNLVRMATVLATGMVTNMNRPQHAFMSSYKKLPPEDEPEEAEDIRVAARKGHLPRISNALLRNRLPSAAVVSNAEAGDAEPAAQRERKIRELVNSMADDNQVHAGATNFLDVFFGDNSRDVDDAANEEGERDAGNKGLDIDVPEPLSNSGEKEILAELKGLRRGSQRIVLQKLLQGGMLRADPTAMAEWQEIQKIYRPPEEFRMKVVDVNRTCKGTRSGGLYRFSAMVVVGNGEGVLGWGQGKATEVGDAVRKAYQRACRNLYPIPRFNGHTIPEPTSAKFGKVKVTMYPKAAGQGMVASSLVADICKLAGIYDIGVKVHGSRNPKNTVKCLFVAFDGMRTFEEVLNSNNKGGEVINVAVPPGRFGRSPQRIAL